MYNFIFEDSWKGGLGDDKEGLNAKIDINQWTPSP
jgi:hypothetical protein